jgi:DHA3 family macrolide efflux protein-like MFS transporter
VALGAIAVLAGAGMLSPVGYISLLAGSSLLHAWGMAGEYALVAEVPPSRHRVAGNALLGATAQITIIVGPALAGVITALAGPAVVLGADAGTFAVLTISYLWAAPLAPGHRGHADGRAASGWKIIRSSRMLLGLLVLTFVFYALYGPVEVALPVWVATDLRGSAELLGWFWTLNAVGVLLGSLCSPWLRQWPLWPTMIAIVAGWGFALTPFGFGAPVGACLTAFARVTFTNPFTDNGADLRLLNLPILLVVGSRRDRAAAWP